MADNQRIHPVQDPEAAAPQIATSLFVPCKDYSMVGHGDGGGAIGVDDGGGTTWSGVGLRDGGVLVRLCWRRQ
ncbi:Hypothetical predicted protein [Olea europaea subsp. europaea]|uniref:Uncharacterized protein n=1 Tax=Olea europaea subsp. europaea TaxID=158383 RepID=A0A8S0RGE4_OLEEU|nr:Hypothetical predicted protein [Olea europaea subsp. europaea]